MALTTFSQFLCIFDKLHLANREKKLTEVNDYLQKSKINRIDSNNSIFLNLILVNLAFCDVV